MLGVEPNEDVCGKDLIRIVKERMELDKEPSHGVSTVDPWRKR